MFKQGVSKFLDRDSLFAERKSGQRGTKFHCVLYGNGATSCVANIVTVVFMAMYLAGYSSDLLTALVS